MFFCVIFTRRDDTTEVSTLVLLFPALPSSNATDGWASAEGVPISEHDCEVAQLICCVIGRSPKSEVCIAPVFLPAFTRRRLR